MTIRMPLSMPEAQAFWLRRLPDLYGETVNYLRRAPLTRPKGIPKVQEASPPNTSERTQREFNFFLARAALVADEALHEDIVQELGMRFFRSVKRGRIWAGNQTVTDARTKKEKVVAYADCWLSRVHRRVAREVARAEARQYLHRCHVPSDDDGGMGAPLSAPARATSPEATASDRETISALERRLMSFPERDTGIFLRHLAGHSHKEIAADFRITEATTRTSVHRTRMRLLHEAGETGHDYGRLLAKEQQVKPQESQYE